MWFRSLFDALLARSARTPVSRIRPVPRVRPLLEILEDRTLLSTYTVNVLTETGAGSGQTGDLLYCVAHATSGNDTITFAPGLTGTIYVQTSLPTVNANVAIQGPGAQSITLDGGGGEMFTVDNAAHFKIAGLTINNGGINNVNGSTTLDSITLSGNSVIWNYMTATIRDSTISGGSVIHNFTTATISDSTISGCNSISSPIYNNSGNLTINNSTISGNKTRGTAAYSFYGGGPSTLGSGGYASASNGMGGGIYMYSGTLSINSSTIADNEAIGGSTAGLGSHGVYAGNGYGGGLYIAGGTVSIDNSTFADNQALGGAGPLTVPGIGYCGGIYNAAGPGALQMHDTILADNTATTAGPDLSGGLTSLGHNLIGNTTGGSGFVASDLVNVNPQLGPLQNNGGPTQTMALLAGSPAINAGDNTNAPAYDQRGPGFPRIVNGIIDIGAFEVQNGTANEASSLAVAGFPSVLTAGNAGSFTVTARNADGSADIGYTGTVHFSSSDGQGVLPANYTFTAADAGVHTFSTTLKTAGTQSITATDATNSGLTATDGSISVNPAAASTMVVGGFPSPLAAGMAGNYTVTLKDAYGNIASGYTGTVHFTSSDRKATLPANYTFTAADAGVHTFSATLKTAGAQSIAAMDTTNSSLSGTDGGITVNPAKASKFILSAPLSVRAGAPFSLTLTVEDAYGNVVAGYTGTIHFGSTDYRARLPTNYTFTAADHGVHTFTGLVLYRKGNQKITVTDTHNSSLTSSVVVDVL